MNPSRDPVHVARRRDAVTRWLAVPMLSLCAAWALWPLETVEPPAAVIVPPPSQVPEGFGATSLNIASFDAPLWHVPPRPVAAAPEPPPPTESPSRLKIIGIIHEQCDGAEIVRAILYDPDTDRLLFAEIGDRVGRHTVISISDAGVELTSGRSRQTLLLDERDKPSKRGSGA